MSPCAISTDNLTAGLDQVEAIAVYWQNQGGKTVTVAPFNTPLLTSDVSSAST